MMSISVDQNLVAAIVQIYRRIHGRDPDEATIVFWLDGIKSGRANLATVESSEQQAQEIDTETAEVLEYQDSENIQDSWSVASVAEVGLGLGSGGAAGASVGGIAAAVGGIAAAAGGGGGGGISNNQISTPAQTASQQPTNATPNTINANGGSSNASGSSNTSTNSPSRDNSVATQTTNDPETQPPTNEPAPNNNSVPEPQSVLQAVGTVKLLANPAYWIGDMFFVDLNQDGIDEIIIAGRKTQPSTISDWSDSFVHVLGFNTGALAVETDLWISAGQNRILGTEPSVRFGDFNGDGLPDIWIAPGTDMNHFGPGVVFMNQNGQYLSRVNLDIGDVWAHDSTVADFNGDGFDDILTVGWGPDQYMIFGRSDGGFDLVPQTFGAYGAGIVAADFLGDGSVTFVITDSFPDGNSDTGLFSWSWDNGGFRLDKISTLPMERFYLDKWDDPKHDWTWQPHSIRVLSHDFDQDGLTDVIVTTLYNDNNNDGHAYTELQFLKNQGQGIFQDVTDTILVGLDHNITAAPRLVDVNRDGLLDIWLTGVDTNQGENSSRVLLANSDGTFTEFLADILSDFRIDVGGDPALVHWVQGPNDQDYLISLERYSHVTDVNIWATPINDYFTGWIV
jgi:hypothetical protein